MGVEVGIEVLGDIFLTAEEAAAVGEGIVVGTEVAYASTTGAAFLSAAVTIGTNFAINMGVNYLLKSVFGSSQQKGATAQGALINSVSNVEPIPVIYGSRRVGGSRILTEVTGASGEFLQLVIVWGEGPVSAVSQIYLDGVAIGDARFAGLTYREDYLGSDTQQASPALIAALGNSAKWNSNCTLSGVAYTYLQLKWDRTAFAQGLPNITADIDGRTLYDPRSSLTAFSHNPWLAIRDYLTNARYGRGVDATVMVDDATFITEANHADGVVSIPGGTQARYTCDGIVNVDDKPIDVLRGLLSSCRGFLVFSGGKYKAKTERSDTPLAFTLSEDNIVGGWSFALPSKRTKFNRVRSRFFDPAQSWQPSIAIQDSAGFRVADNGLVLESQLELPFTSNLYRAQQLAQVAMKRSRFGILVSFTATIAAMQLEVGDVVPVTHATPGWVGKLFRVAEIELLANDEVRLSLLEYDATAYNLDALAAVNTAPATNLPDALHPAATGAPAIAESLYQTSGSAGVKSRATASWMASADTFVQNGGWYQLERSPTGAGSWTIYPRIQSPGPGAGTVSFAIDDVAPAVYDWRVKAFNSLGAGSAYSPTTTKEILGLNAPPSNVANFAVQSYSGQAKFTWDKLSPATDLATLIGGRIVVRWSPLTGGASWQNGSLVNPDGYPGDTSIGFGPLMTGTYMAKAWNGKTYSVTEAIFVATEALLTGLTTLATVTEDPVFSGAKSNVAAVGGGIQLDGTTLIDSMLTNIDSWSFIDALGGVRASGSYTFNAKLDLGSKQPARLFSTIKSLAFDTGDFIDQKTDLIDSWGLIDGAVIEDADVKLWVRTTDDDPNSGSPTWSAYQPLGLVADYNFRGFDFRLDFATGTVTHNRQVTQLSVAAKH